MSSTTTTSQNCSQIYCLLGGFLIGIGTILILVELINDSESWTLRIIGITSLVIGCILIFLYTKCATSQNLNCNSSGVNNIGPPNTNVKGTDRSILQKNSFNNICDPMSDPISKSSTSQNSFQNQYASNYIASHSSPSANRPSPSTVPSKHAIEHYKARHFSGHGYRPQHQMKSAPLACQEDITPSLRSSFNSLYLYERSSEESETSSANSMIYIP